MKSSTTTLADAMGNSKLAHLRTHVTSMESLTESFHENFGHFGRASKVSHVTTDTLSIQVGNSILLTRLRFQEPAIVKWAQTKIESIINVKITIEPSLY